MTTDTENIGTFPIDTSGMPDGMVISLPGVLERAAECCKRSRNYKELSFWLEKLEEHIEQLRESPTDKEAVRRLAQFLNLWRQD